MSGLVLRCTAVTPIPAQALAAAMTDLDRPLRTTPERVLRSVPLEPADLADALAFVARSASLPSVRAGRRRWSVVRAAGVVA